jgi:hypothetical protein
VRFTVVFATRFTVVLFGAYPAILTFTVYAPLTNDKAFGVEPYEIPLILRFALGELNTVNV